MKKILCFLFLGSILISCNNNPNTEKTTSPNPKIPTIENDLLPTKVIVYNEVNYKIQSIPEWTQGVDTVYMNQLNEAVLNSDVQLYSSNIEYLPNTKEKMSHEDVRNYMKANGGISALYFIDSWIFNKEAYTFTKNVESWSPVLEFTKKNKNDNGETVLKKSKMLLYDLRNSPSNYQQKIAENIRYEVSFNDDITNNKYLDVEKFAHLIIDPVLKGEKKAYDFFEKTELKPIDIKYTLGYSVDSVEEENPETGEWVSKVIETAEDFSSIKAFIFTEDWYIDNKTFAIRKEVKSIAPVIIKTKIDSDGEAYQSKKIAFLVKLN